MKKMHYMTAVSLAALIAAAPALAADNNAETDKPLTQEMKEGWQDTKDSASSISGKAAEKAGDMKDAASNAMKDDDKDKSAKADDKDIIEVSVLDLNASNAAAAEVRVDERMTADGIIGKPVYNEKNERVATVEDVILDADGKANMVVVKDHKFMTLGNKLAAFDYDAIIDRKEDGDLVMPITEKSIENVAEFSYKTTDKPTVKAMPDRGYSIKKILAGDLVDPSGKKLAAIDNLTLKDGRAKLVIASYNQILNMGGDKVAIDLDSAQLVAGKDKDDEVDVKLSDAQARKLSEFTAKK
jgi:sporulation protein YlmC with PRC-barrel domain